MQIQSLGVLWRRLTFILFIYLFTFLLIHLFIDLLLLFFSNSVIIFVVIEIFLLGLFCTRLDWEYLCTVLLGVLGQIDDGFNGFSQNPSFGQIGEFLRFSTKSLTFCNVF